MGRGANKAEVLREKYCLKDKIDLSLLEDLCFSEGAFLKYEKIEGAQGRLMFSKKSSYSIITINSEIDYTPKKKFVIAHELGHNALHRGKMNFVCDDDDLNSWDRKNKYEYEANDFASDFLMPRFSIRSLTEGQELSVDLIESIALDFGTSLTSTCIQYCKYGNIPCYVVASTNGRITWVSNSIDFYLGYLSKGAALPKRSNANLFFQKGIKQSKQVCMVKDWFPDHKKQDLYLYEDAIYLENYSTVLSLLWICEDY